MASYFSGSLLVLPDNANRAGAAVPTHRLWCPHNKYNNHRQVSLSSPSPCPLVSTPRIRTSSTSIPSSDCRTCAFGESFLLSVAARLSRRRKCTDLSGTLF